MYRWLAMLVLVLGSVRPAAAQRLPLDSLVGADSTRFYVFRLSDGSTIIGNVVGSPADSVRVRTRAGVMSLGRSSIASVERVDPSRIRNGVYWFENPHATRLLFSSTAFPMEKGSGYYSNTWLLLHTVAAGITDRLTLGGGLAWFPGISLDETFYYFLPKYTVMNREKTKLAVGALVGLLPFGLNDESSTAGLLYGVGTIGSGDSNISGGLGWGYFDDDLAKNPVVMIGGQHRFNRRLSFISENWVFPIDGETEGVYSYGLRFLGESITADLAYVSVFGETQGAPWLGFSFRF